MASIAAAPPILNKYNNILTDYDEEECKNFIYLMSSIHDSFDQILQLRHSGHTFFGRTLSAFENELNLKNILNSIIPNNQNGVLSIGDVRDFLIKDFNHDNINSATGIMGWACVEGQPLKAIEVVNPKHDLFDKWVSIIGKANPGKANYKQFLQHQDIKKSIVSFTNKTDEDVGELIDTKSFSTSIKTNISQMLRDHDRFYVNTADEWKNRANGWMNADSLPDDTPFDPNIHHIVFQEIATVNYSLWETSDVKESNYHLFMRGAEIITRNIRSDQAVQRVTTGPGKTHTSVLPHHHIFFPVSSEGLNQLHLLADLGNDSTKYFEYNDVNNPIDKIMTFKKVFDDGKQFHRKLYQMTTRAEYKHQGMPVEQQYRSPPHPNSTTTRPPPAQIFKTTPYSQDQGLICSLCTRVIEDAKQGTDPDDWSPIFNGKRQSYDVDHLLNLIFNDLFNLNLIDHGLGFTNTCGDCNRAFKSEKIWSPSLALWEELIVKAKLETQYKNGLYLWPGRVMEGLKVRNSSRQKKPFDGYRAFTIEHIRKDLSDQINKTGDNTIEFHNQKFGSTKPENANKSQGITWKNQKADTRTQTFDNNATNVPNKNFQDIEEIFLNRIMKLIELRNNINDEDGNTTLVTDVLLKESESPGNGFASIVSKYVKGIQLWPLVDFIRAELQRWDDKAPGKTQLAKIMQNIQSNEQAISGGINPLMRSDTLQKYIPKEKRWKYLIGVERKDILRMLGRLPQRDPRRKRWYDQLNRLTDGEKNKETWIKYVALQTTIKKISAPSTGPTPKDGATMKERVKKTAEAHKKTQKTNIQNNWATDGGKNAGNLAPGQNFPAEQNRDEEFNAIEELDTKFINEDDHGDGSTVGETIAKQQGAKAFDYIKTRVNPIISERRRCRQIKSYADKHFVIAQRAKETHERLAETHRAKGSNALNEKNKILSENNPNNLSRKDLTKHLKDNDPKTYEYIKSLLKAIGEHTEEENKYAAKAIVHTRREFYYQQMSRVAQSCGQNIATSSIISGMLASQTGQKSGWKGPCANNEDCEDPLECVGGKCEWTASPLIEEEKDDISGDEEKEDIPNLSDRPNQSSTRNQSNRKRALGSDVWGISHQGQFKRGNTTCDDPFCTKKAIRQDHVTNKVYCQHHYNIYSTGGGNKTRKNRRRKNKTKRKKKNKKKNTKKHRRRKNKTRTRR